MRPMSPADGSAKVWRRRGTTNDDNHHDANDDYIQINKHNN